MWKHDLGVIPDSPSGYGNELLKIIVAAAHSEKSACSLNAAISSSIQLVESYYCAMNTSLNISEVALLQTSFAALKY